MNELQSEFTFVIDAVESTVREEVEKFYDDLVKTSPVDTGAFKKAWSIHKPVKGFNYVIQNSMDYADVLARGRVNINGRWYGSLGQHPSGSWSIPLALKIKNLERDIERRTDDIQP